MKYIFFISLVPTFIFLTNCNQSNQSKNPPEIVDRDSDTVFNRVPGKQHLGDDAFDANIIDLLENIRKTTHYLETIDNHGLRDTLATSGPFTVIALSDAAYDDLKSRINSSDNTSTSLESEEFIKSLILKGKISRNELTEGPVTTENLNGDTIILSIENGDLKINDKVYKSSEEFPASNGIVHEIDEWSE